jgi:hypothetical protein
LHSLKERGKVKERKLNKRQIRRELKRILRDKLRIIYWIKKDKVNTLIIRIWKTLLEKSVIKFQKEFLENIDSSSKSLEKKTSSWKSL